MKRREKFSWNIFFYTYSNKEICYKVSVFFISSFIHLLHDITHYMMSVSYLHYVKYLTGTRCVNINNYDFATLPFCWYDWE